MALRKVGELLALLGAPYDARCLDFHENRRYARDASYAQVTEQLYARSRYRYGDCRDLLTPVIPLLEPIPRWPRRCWRRCRLAANA
jgi:hypothetical protein